MESANIEYQLLHPKMVTAFDQGNLLGALAVARQIDHLYRPIVGDTSKVMARIWCNTYSTIYTGMQNYRMVYKVNDTARRVLAAMKDTLNVDYLESLLTLSNVCFLLKPRLVEEGLGYLKEYTLRSEQHPNPGIRATGYINAAERAMNADELPYGRRMLNKAREILDTLTPQVNEMTDLPDTLALYQTKINFLHFTTLYNTKIGQLDVALKANSIALDVSEKFTESERQKYYVLLIERAAVFVVRGNYDSADNCLKRVINRNELKELTYLNQSAGMVQSLVMLARNAGAGKMDLKGVMALMGNSSTIDEDLKLYFEVSKLMFEAIQDPTLEIAAQLTGIRKKIEADAFNNPDLKITLDLLGTYSRVMQSGETEQVNALLNLAETFLQNAQRALPFMTETEQIRMLNLFNYTMDAPFIRPTNTYSPEQLKRMLWLQLQRKSIVLRAWQGLRGNALRTSDILLQNSLKDWKSLRQEAVRSVSLGKPRRTIDSLRNLVQLMETAISERIPYQVWTADSLQKLLNDQPTDIVHIEFMRIVQKTSALKDSAIYKAFVFSSQTAAPVLVDLCTEEQLLKLIKGCDKQPCTPIMLSNLLYSPTSANAKKVYELIWKPITPLMKKKSTIYLSKAGLLNNISFAGLYDGKQHLIKYYQIHETTDLPGLWQRKVGQVMPKQAWVWGNIDYGSAPAVNVNKLTLDDQGGLLPGNQMIAGLAVPLAPITGANVMPLVKQLKQQGLDVVPFTNDLAKEETFKNMADSLVGLLHITTHGFYKPATKMAETMQANAFENPLLHSALAFAGANQYWLTGRLKAGDDEDGLLTAYEIAELNLSNVSLATLSACETALGQTTDNEGNLGLVRGLRLAGVPKVLASLWPVPAKATNELMQTFYKNWQNLPNPAEALRKAQMTLLAKGYPPFYWAGWVVVE